MDGVKRSIFHESEGALKRSKTSSNGFSVEHPVSVETAHQWQITIDRVIKSVVAVRFSQVASFDSDSAIVSEATGFVVDAERGIILTNRHVVCSGPFVGYAVFDNHEETDVKPVYRDPVHDFGFLKFDPQTIKYMKVSELKLRPDLAKVGAEIRVVGNDAGEKLSILSGFISRVDRNAPNYGMLTYNDFNTEYIQAAASASGGSSGSPVIDINGNTLALQAGGLTDSATDFFLPVYRVLRALRLLQSGQPITRGTIQVQWYLKPFDECRRLGLSEKAEETARQLFPNIVSLLVAETILPEGPADGKIKEGDILISINDTNISTFIQIDDILDSCVGQTVHVLLQRNGVDVEVDCTVQDLHGITPSRYVEICGASFNDLSYQMARIYVVPTRGVFVNAADGCFNFDGSSKGFIIDSVDNKDTPNLDKFIEVMKSIPDRKFVPVAYRHLSDKDSKHISLIQVDRHWTGGRIATRNDLTGLWDFTSLGKPQPSEPLKPLGAKFIDVPNEEPQCSKLVRSFVLVTTSLPYTVDCYPYSSAKGYGVVIDADKGYVLVSRKYVPHDLCSVLVTIAESIIVPAKVVFMHPFHNYSVIQYDPKLVLAPVLTPRFSTTKISRGDNLNFVGYNYNLRVLAAKTRVTDLASLNVPYNFYSPRFRGLNSESVIIDNNAANDCDTGVLADNDGTIRGFWLDYLGESSCDGVQSAYRLGVDVNHMSHIIQSLQNNTIPNVKVVDAEFSTITISSARQLGVAEKWISTMEQKEKDRFQFLSVLRITCPLDPINEDDKLNVGDVILTINGMLISRLSEVGTLCDQTNNQKLDFVIVRNNKEISLKVKPVEIPNTDHVVLWCGAELQAPHHSVRQGIKELPSKVYVSNVASGSPAVQYSIGTTNFITHVNEVPVTDIKSFMNEVKKIPDQAYCKLRIVSFDGIPFAISLKTNYHYFSTSEVQKNPDGNWEMTSYDKEYNIKEKRIII